MIDHAISDSGRDFLAVRAPASYRIVLASWLPAMQLAYVLLVWPLFTFDATPSNHFGLAPPSVPEETILNKLIPPVIALLALGVFMAERPAVSRRMRLSMAVLLAFWAFAASSVAWSIQPATALTEIIRFALLYGSVAVGCLVARSVSQVLKPILFVLAVTIVANLIAIPMVEATQIGHAGIYRHKNTFGLVSSIAMIFLAGSLDRRKPAQSVAALLGIAACCVFLWISQSKTALALTLLTPILAAVFYVTQKYLGIAFPVAVLLLVATALATFWLVQAATGFSSADISMMISGEPTFTGRAELWQFAAAMISERPLLGHGFNTFWQIGADSPALHAPGFIGKATHGHSGYYDLLLHLGLTGLCLYLLLLLFVAGNINRILRLDPRTGFLMTSLIVFICLRELLETNILTALGPCSVVFALLVCLPLIDDRTEQRHV